MDEIAREVDRLVTAHAADQFDALRERILKELGGSKLSILEQAQLHRLLTSIDNVNLGFELMGRWVKRRT